MIIVTLVKMRIMTLSDCISSGPIANVSCIPERITPQLVKKFPTVFGTRIVFAIFTKLVPEQFSPRPNIISLRYVLVLSSHLLLGFPICRFPSDVVTKILYVTLLSPIRATCPACLILLDLSSRIFCEEYRS